MNKAEMKDLIKKYEEERKALMVFFKYCKGSFCLIPVKSGDKLFLSAQEEEFILDGFTVRQFKDIKKIITDGMVFEIIEHERFKERIEMPLIDISDWKTIFKSLKCVGKNIIVEKESLNEDESEFVIGSIENIYNRFAYVRHFDADGVWQDEPYRIPYSEITSITFLSRYVDTFSKYISKPPQAKRG